MKRLLRSYTSFTRPERNGLIGLCLLLATLVAVRVAIKQGGEKEKNDARMVGAFHQLNRQQNGEFLKSSPKSKRSATNLGTGESGRSVRSGVQTGFDPNTVDSLTLRNFNLRPLTISNLMKWRSKGKRFYRKEDLKPLYTLTADEYDMLEPYIDIKQLQVDLNHADSATLINLRGIGPKIAHKILVRRSTIGPFTHPDQLRELYRFPDSVFEELKKEIVITP